jgi:hypothetical protein
MALAVTRWRLTAPPADTALVTGQVAILECDEPQLSRDLYLAVDFDLL